MSSYYGRSWDWCAGGKCGRVELRVVTGIRADDEMMARKLVRDELGVKRLPRGAVVVPTEPPKGKETQGSGKVVEL